MNDVKIERDESGEAQLYKFESNGHVIYGHVTSNVVDQYWAAYCQKSGEAITITNVTKEVQAYVARDMDEDPWRS
jgi:hypothetical protein